MSDGQPSGSRPTVLTAWWGCRAFPGAAALLAALACAHAQPYSGGWSTVAGGGGTGANSRQSLTGTAGQPSTGTQSDGRFTLQGGFWSFLAGTGASAVIPSSNIVWTNTKGGKWSVATNWKPNQVPGPTDTATLDLRSTYTVAVDASQTVGNLTLGSGATLAGTNPLSVLGALTWTGGNLTSLLQCNGGTVSGTNSHTQNGGRLVNAGTLQLSATITTAGGALITNLPGAILELAGDVGITYSSGAYGAVINQGTLRKSSGAGVSSISEVVSNTGMVEMRSGTLELSRPFFQSDGATVVREGQLQVDQGMLLAGGELTGTNLISGTVSNSGGVLAPGLSPGALQINGRYVQTSGGTLAIELGGPNRGTAFDVLIVNGVVKLGGTLAVSLVNGFTPAAGSTFEFLDAASCYGAFETFSPALSSLGLVTVYAPDHVALSAGAPPARRLPRYSLTDLGGLATGGCWPEAINNRGQVAGFAQSTNGYRAFVWDQGTMTDLGTLAGANSYAYGINDAGHVVGWSTVSASTAPFHAFYWDGTRHDLGSLGTANQSSYAYGINNNDEIIGYSDLMVDGGSSTHPFLDRSGTMIDLHSPFFPGNTNAGAFAYGLNDRLQIVGYGPRPVGSADGFLYDYIGGAVRDVGDLGGANGSVARAVNSAGQATGWAVTDGNLYNHAFLFDGRIHDLGTLGGHASSGFAINGKGQVVGRSDYLIGTTEVTPHAFLWTDGQMIDLNLTILPNSGWDLREATGINDRGQIVGNAYWHSTGRGFLLTPLPALQLRLAAGGGLVLVWSIENQGFTLQENATLSPSGWATVNVTPTVVGNEVRVVLPQPTANRFYRLVQP